MESISSSSSDSESDDDVELSFSSATCESSLPSFRSLDCFSNLILTPVTFNFTQAEDGLIRPIASIDVTAKVENSVIVDIGQPQMAKVDNRFKTLKFKKKRFNFRYNLII